MPTTLRLIAIPLLLIVAGTVPSAQLRPQPVGELPGDVALQLMLRKLGSRHVHGDRRASR